MIEESFYSITSHCHFLALATCNLALPYSPTSFATFLLLLTSCNVFGESALGHTETVNVALKEKEQLVM